MRTLIIYQILLYVSLVGKIHCSVDGWWDVHSLEVEDLINCTTTLAVSADEIEISRGENVTVTYTIQGSISECVTLYMISDPRNITTIPEPTVLCQTNGTNLTAYDVTLKSFHEGIVILEVVTEDEAIICTDDSYFTLSVKIKPSIDTVSDVIGWIYTVAWDASFLPQIYHNYKRQSVIGLSFDFLTFNFIGFSCYGLYNIGLYFIPAIQDEYELRNPHSVLHVRLNDVIFPVYAVLCVFIQILQCIFYERGNQRVSYACRIISTCLILVAIIYLILVGTVDHIWWIDFLYALSYIKLAITCIKYFPQLYENYKQKSTEGWSIWQVILDFTGGSLSLLQMFLLAYNYDDFHSVLTDPSKLGLGLLSVFFNIFFFLQHYVLYRHKPLASQLTKKEEVGITTITSLYADEKENKIDEDT